MLSQLREQNLRQIALSVEFLAVPDDEAAIEAHDYFLLGQLYDGRDLFVDFWKFREHVLDGHQASLVQQGLQLMAFMNRHEV